MTCQRGWTGSSATTRGSLSLEHISPPLQREGHWYEHTLGSSATRAKKRNSEWLERLMLKNKDSGMKPVSCQPGATITTRQRDRADCGLRREQKKERERENNSVRKHLSNVSGFQGHLCCVSAWPSRPAPFPFTPPSLSHWL